MTGCPPPLLVAAILAAACASTTGGQVASITSPGSGEVKAGKYATFFRQVRQRVDSTLRCPDRSEVPTAARGTGRRWKTRLRVIMTTEGAVHHASVDVSSGRNDVDQAALAAMKAAAPFRDAPRELFQPDGTAEFRFGVECAAVEPRSVSRARAKRGNPAVPVRSVRQLPPAAGSSWLEGTTCLPMEPPCQSRRQ